MKRNDILTGSGTDDNGDEIEYMENDSVISFIDQIEGQVNDAKDYLESIKSVDDLSQVEQCLDILKDISTDLY